MVVGACGDLGRRLRRRRGPLRRQDSNLNHWNQNPRCCRYTTADRPGIIPRGVGGADGGEADLSLDPRRGPDREIRELTMDHLGPSSWAELDALTRTTR